MRTARTVRHIGFIILEKPHCAIPDDMVSTDAVLRLILLTQARCRDTSEQPSPPLFAVDAQYINASATGATASFSSSQAANTNMSNMPNVMPTAPGYALVNGTAAGVAVIKTVQLPAQAMPAGSVPPVTPNLAPISRDAVPRPLVKQVPGMLSSGTSPPLQAAGVGLAHAQSVQVISISESSQGHNSNMLHVNTHEAHQPLQPVPLTRRDRSNSDNFLPMSHTRDYEAGHAHTTAQLMHPQAQAKGQMAVAQQPGLNVANQLQQRSDHLRESLVAHATQANTQQLPDVVNTAGAGDVHPDGQTDSVHGARVTVITVSDGVAVPMQNNALVHVCADGAVPNGAGSESRVQKKVFTIKDQEEEVRARVRVRTCECMHVSVQDTSIT
jgi:hypothetical protein